MQCLQENIFLSQSSCLRTVREFNTDRLRHQFREQTSVERSSSCVTLENVWLKFGYRWNKKTIINK